jgi:DNA uptake protein ComE-like DNA-binding protein
MKTIILLFCTVGLLLTVIPASAQTPCVDVETATAKQLQTLVSVGPALAKRLVDHRRAKRAAATKTKKAKWNFRNWKALYQVPGVTGVFCAKNQARVCFSGKVQKTCPKYTPPKR